MYFMPFKRSLTAAILAGTICFTCSLTPSRPVVAAGGHYAKENAASQDSVPSVAIGGGSSFELKRAAILPNLSGNTLFFTLTVSNGGDSELLFSDYLVRIIDADGREYVAELLPEDMSKNSIPPKGGIDFSFYATVQDTTEMKDLTFRMTQWDYNSSNFEKHLGDIQLTDEDLTPSSQRSSGPILLVGNVPVRASISRESWRENEKYATTQLTLQLENTGGVSVTLPGYRYQLRSEEGVMYLLDEASAASEHITLQPNSRKEIQLRSTTLPASLNRSNLELAITEPIVTEKAGTLYLPQAFVSLSGTGQLADSAGDTREFENPNGLYGLTLQKVQRIPWEEQDLLTAELWLTNRGGAGQPLPELASYFELDDGVKVEGQMVQMDALIGIPSAKTVRYKVMGKIPYEYAYEKARLAIQEKAAGHDAAADVAEFLLPVETVKMEEIPYGSKREVKVTGRSLLYSPKEIRTYADKSSQLLEVRVEVENVNIRSTSIPKLAAFIQTADGALYATRVRELKSKLNPNGKAVISFWTKLPPNASTEGMKLILGDAVTGDHISGAEDKPQAYLEPAVFELPQENKAVASDLHHVDLHPYELSLSNIDTYLDGKELRLSFNYDLSKDSYYETSSDGEKVIIQLKDKNGLIAFDEQFYFENGPDDDDKALEIGEHTYKMVRADKDLLYKVEGMSDYILSVYHVYQGQRRLVASRAISWFSAVD